MIVAIVILTVYAFGLIIMFFPDFRFSGITRKLLIKVKPLTVHRNE